MIITFLIYIIQKREYLQSAKRYAEKKNDIFLYSEEPFKQAEIIFYFMGTLRWACKCFNIPTNYTSDHVKLTRPICPFVIPSFVPLRHHSLAGEPFSCISIHDLQCHFLVLSHF